MAGRFAALTGVVAIQVVVLSVLAAALGWRPEPAGLGWALLLVLLGCLAFGALGILLGGTLRAEITLAVANVVWFVLLLAGGIVVPLAQLPGPLAAVGALLPSGALAEGLRLTLSTGQPPAPPDPGSPGLGRGGRRSRAARRQAPLTPPRGSRRAPRCAMRTSNLRIEYPTCRMASTAARMRGTGAYDRACLDPPCWTAFADVDAVDARAGGRGRLAPGRDRGDRSVVR